MQVRGSGAEAVAISLLFSFANPETERRVEAALRSLGLPISASHRILPEFREYERASTTVVNAYLAPRMQNYLLHLEQRVAEPARRRARGRDAVVGRHYPGAACGPGAGAHGVVGPGGRCHRRLPGGALGRLRAASSASIWAAHRPMSFSPMQKMARSEPASPMVAGVPVSMPMLDIHTAGAGGGSIARFDAGGMLRVGPESAGAEPGPICFGRGTMPTVTDANLLLGRLDQESFLGGGVRLDRQRTEQIMREQKGSLATVEDVRRRHSPRGGNTDGESHPRDLRRARPRSAASSRWWPLAAEGRCMPARWRALCAFPRVLVPAMPGALSAVGILAGGHGAGLFAHGDAAGRCDSRTLERHLRGTGAARRRRVRCRRPAGYGQCTRGRALSRQGYELNVPFDKQSSGAIHRSLSSAASAALWILRCGEDRWRL